MNISAVKFDKEILTILNLELEKITENIDPKKVGQSLIELVSKKLESGLITIDDASSKNYSIQLHFLQETDHDLVGYNLDDLYQLARQKI